ncbi:MAG: hypothetical protein FJW32_01900 [Acidobacteria bacterium]|nr:hypothetical protein [Acidobacteriota bacterium]
MSLINKTASVMHSQHGWFVSDSFTDAPVGSWGTKDGDLFEKLGLLKDVNKGVPDPVLETIPRTPRWFLDNGVSTGTWKVGAKDKTGLASLSITLEFSSKYSIACFLSSYDEIQMRNTDPVGDALSALYREPGKDWKLNKKWVYTGLRVKSGFIVMSLEKDTKVTISGKGTVSVSGVPVDLQVSGLQTSGKSSAELTGLDGVTPFLKLAEVFDPIWQKADWHQIG